MREQVLLVDKIRFPLDVPPDILWSAGGGGEEDNLGEAPFLCLVQQPQDKCSITQGKFVSEAPNSQLGLELLITELEVNKQGEVDGGDVVRLRLNHTLICFEMFHNILQFPALCQIQILNFFSERSQR